MGANPNVFESVSDVETALNSDGLSVRDLYALYEQREPVPDDVAASHGQAPTVNRQIRWLQKSIALAREFTQRAMEKEEFLLVCDVAAEAYRYWAARERDVAKLVPLKMDYAAALTRLGSTRQAAAELDPFKTDARLDQGLRAQILLRLGDILHEESQHAITRADQLATAEKALWFYEDSLKLDPDCLEAVAKTAAAAMALSEPATPRRQHAQEHATRALALADKLDAKNAAPSFGTTLARATAHCVLEDAARATQYYRQLKGLSEATPRDLAEARYRSQLLAESLGEARDFFDDAFPKLELVVFVGHLPDLPGAPARFPSESIEPVRLAIREALRKDDVRVGLVSAAAGADLLFADELLARGGTVHVILPWSREEFRISSVRRFETANGPKMWEPLFDRIIENATTVRELGQVYEPRSEVGWDYMLEVTAGLALNIARHRRMDVRPMAVWDRSAPHGSGGTASFVKFWRRELERDALIIGLPPADGVGNWLDTDDGPIRRCQRPTSGEVVKSMLFADIVGYSKLGDQHILDFVETFMERVSNLSATSKHAPRSVNTWGDAIYAVFDYALDAGAFALELTQMIEEGTRDWVDKGLYWDEYASEGKPPIRHTLSVRIGLHTGPVYMHFDPICRRLGYTGAHVNRAARIEPVAKPGQVFASLEFAALAELDVEIARRKNNAAAQDLASGFVCEYAGTMQLAKGYPGRFPIYRVLPKRMLALEELAKGVHKAYCDKARVRGEPPPGDPSLRPWEQLTEDLRDANRAQVTDIPNKLRFLGYELAPSHGMLPSEIHPTVEQIEELSIREHDRWAKERRDRGWTFGPGPKKDPSRKLHPSLVPWEQLPEDERKKDRDVILNMPQLIERAGLRVRKLPAMP